MIEKTSLPNKDGIAAQIAGDTISQADDEWQRKNYWKPLDAGTFDL